MIENAGEPTTADLLRMYLSTLQARMDPDQLRVLWQMLRGLRSFVVSGERHGGLVVAEEDEKYVTSEVYAELVNIIGILGGNGMGHQLVDLGNGVRILVDSETVADPERFELISRGYREIAERRQQGDSMMLDIVVDAGKVADSE